MYTLVGNKALGLYEHCSMYECCPPGSVCCTNTCMPAAECDAQYVVPCAAPEVEPAVPGPDPFETASIEVCSQGLPCKYPSDECCYWFDGAVPAGVTANGACVPKGTCASYGGSTTPPAVKSSPVPPPPPAPTPVPKPYPKPGVKPSVQYEPAPPPEKAEFPYLLVFGAVGVVGLFGYAVYRKKKSRRKV